MNWKTWFDRYRKLGIAQDLSFDLAQRIELLNLGVLFLICINLLNALFFANVVRSPEVYNYFFATILMYLAFPMLNHWHMHRVARFGFSIYIHLNILLFVYLFGKETLFQYYYTTTIMVSVLLFTKEETGLRLLAVAMPFACTLFLYKGQFAPQFPLSEAVVGMVRFNTLLSLALINLFVVWVSDWQLRRNSHILDKLTKQTEAQKELLRKREEILRKEREKIIVHQQNLENIIHQRTKALIEKQEELQTLLKDHQRKIFELEETKEKLSKAQQEALKFVQTVAYSADCIILSNLEGDVIYINPAGQELLRLKENASINLKELLEANSRESFERIAPLLYEQKHWRGELNLIGQGSGVPIVCDALLFLVQDKNKEHTICLAGIFRDIREQKAAQQQMQQMQLHLAEKEKMASIGLLTAGIAHELKNPINFILGSTAPFRRYVDYLQSIMECVEEVVASPGKQSIEKLKMLARQASGDQILQDIKDLSDSIEEGARRINTIISELLTFARTEDQMQFCNLNALIEQSLRFIKPELSKRKIELDWQGSQHLPAIEAFPARLQQVIINLCTNAIHAMPHGGKLRIRTWHMKEREVMITVEDTGSGMPEHVRRHIFEPFYTTKKTGEGTGLGLFIVYGIVEQHGGSITVESQEGKGSVFKIQLPIQHAREDE
ncbi:signal transduction histidine kinase [Thermonema lapsum]|uniref:histidine kinase n=1 Tax=Thermonema lapsum TaxID=28195 RepID=A0A846MMJ8_9BACT|nr:ATP-binding protein [Thermonema lapsum]NIK72652.1 signal transduction histidine kinase [Thermonema lapsum]